MTPVPEPGDDATEFDKMMRGELYLHSNPYILKIAKSEAAKVCAINAETDASKRAELLREFMGISRDVDFYWIPPLFAEFVRG